MRKIFISLALALAASTAFAAGNRTENFERMLNVQPGSAVEIENVNGRITVRSWDQPRLRIQAVKTVRSSDDDTAQAALRELRIEVKQTAGGIRIETIYPKRGNEGLFGLFGASVNASVQYELTVPRQTGLKVENTNGAIEVSDVTGKIELETTNGGIQVRRCAGAVDANTTNGAITADLLQITPGSSMRLETTNGHISLSVPRGASAEINAGTTNGAIRSDLPLATSRFSRTSLRGSLNGGGPEIRLRTTNGSIDITATAPAGP